MTKIVERWQSQEILAKFCFWSESIQNVLKLILNRKSRSRKYFPITKFFPWTLSFFAQNDQNRGKMTVNFFGLIVEINLAPKAKASFSLRTWPTKREAFHSFGQPVELK